MKKLYTFTFALIVLLSMAMSVEALESKTISRQNGVSASAGWTETNGDVITDTYLFVTESNDGTDIYLEIYTYNVATGDSSYKSGYVPIEVDVFSIDKKLNSASLSEVEIMICDWYTCDTVKVKADWTSTGNVMRDSYKSTSKSGDFTFRSSGSSSYREATATGSIDSGSDVDNLGESYFANLAKFKQADMSMEK